MVKVRLSDRAFLHGRTTVSPTDKSCYPVVEPLGE